MKNKELHAEESVTSAWLTAPGDLSLGGHEVHIWRAALDLPDGGIETLTGSLSPDEVSRSEKYRFRRDQKRFIAGRGILRHILARYLETEPGRIVFSYNAQGKPFLRDPFSRKDLSFNLSHAHNLALYAITVKRRLGIDLEYHQKVIQWEEITERFFSSNEQAVLCTLPEEERCRAFFSCWTRKEAVLKAIGTGLTDDIREINVVSMPPETACVSRVSHPRNISGNWELIDLEPGPGYAGALAVEDEGMSVQCWQWM